MQINNIKTISELSQLDGRVYVYLPTDKLAKQFMRQAEAEGFTFADGVKPTDREAPNFIAVNSNHTLNYVGSFGRMAYSIKTATVDGQQLFRVVYSGAAEIEHGSPFAWFEKSHKNPSVESLPESYHEDSLL